jgi:hypothetical protein
MLMKIQMNLVGVRTENSSGVDSAVTTATRKRRARRERIVRASVLDGVDGAGIVTMRGTSARIFSRDRWTCLVSEELHENFETERRTPSGDGCTVKCCNIN